MAGLFVTGTDTEIGKTFVSSLLIRLLAEENYKVAGMKPVASGADEINGELKNEDALSLIKAANVTVDYKSVNPYVFAPAVSPHIAAKQAATEINFEIITDHYNELAENADIVVVEGVGGWYAPLSMQTTVADLAEAMHLPVIVVVGLRLGCLNHSLLTAQAIRQSGLEVAGWIANHIEEDFDAVEQNITTLKEFLNDFPYLGSVCYQTDTSDPEAKHTIDSKCLVKALSFKK